jgi:hypothetical protein
MTKFRKTAITGSFAATAPAQAGNNGAFVAGLIGGAVVTGIIAANTAPVYGAPVYPARCWYQPQVVGYDQYGRQVIQNVRYCQ